MDLPNLNSDYPPSSYPITWEFLGHKIVNDGGEYGYPGIGFERSISCSCGAWFRSGRWPAPESTVYDVWNQYREHVKKFAFWL
jgi:hypothetical protein